MEFYTDGGRELTVRARDYSLAIDSTPPWLTISWSGGRVRLEAGAGEAPTTWSLTSDRAASRITLSASDGRRLILDPRDDLVWVRAELPEAGDAPALLAGPDLPQFRSLFSPEPTALRRSRFAPDERAVAAIGSDPSFHGGHWFFSPPPFCFGLEAEVGSLAVGVAASLDELDFSALEYDGAFRLRYDHPPAGAYASPRLVLLPVGGDGYEAVSRYCALLRDEGLAPRWTGRERAAWWSEPNFCGWGEQSYRRAASSGFRCLCSTESGDLEYRLPEGIQAESTQAMYQDALARLEAEGLDPGVVTVDDKWQLHYGAAQPDPTRWPDMPGFIASQHARGRKVLLWWKLWDGEGLPPEDLLEGAARPVVDPTSPSYRSRLAGEVRRALLELGADGFKLDFLHKGPSAEHGRSRSGVAGVRLVRAMLKALREPALDAKADCLLVAHAANPYLADLADVVRLNDVSCIPGDGSFLGEMRHRARIARAACLDALIDADNWPSPDRRQWAEYVAAQPEVGIPALYYATGIDLSAEPLLPEDYALVRDSWQRWKQQMGE